MRLWDFAMLKENPWEEQKEIAVLDGHGGGIVSPAFSPDVDILASTVWSDVGPEVRLWDAVGHQEMNAAKLRTKTIV